MSDTLEQKVLSIDRKWHNKEHLLLTRDDSTSDGQTSSPASQDDTVLVTESPVADLLLEIHAVPLLRLLHLLLI